MVLEAKHKNGVGMTISRERLEILNGKMGEHCEVKVLDKGDLPDKGQGTIVIMAIPLE